MNEHTDTRLAVVGSPSSCDTVVLNLLKSAYHVSLLGRMLMFRAPFDDGGDELALATVTSVETINPHHRADARVGSHIADGATPGNSDSMAHNILSGDGVDTRAVTVKVEAVFRQVEGIWTRYASTLSNSPATGTPVELLGQETVNEVLGVDSELAYIGALRGSGVQIPFTLDNFSGPRGARHSLVAGVSGSGKSALASSLLSTQLRHTHQGHVVVDPQGQWSFEHATLWSLQGLARSLGRKVTVSRLSHSLRLRKDAPLLMNLLGEAGFFRKLAFGSGADDNVAQAKDVLAAALNNRRLLNKSGIDDWTETKPDVLLRFLLEELHAQLPAGMIYASREPQRRVAATIYRPTEDSDGNPLDQDVVDRISPGALDADGQEKFDQLMHIFAPLASLWSPWSPTGMAKILDGTPTTELTAEDKRQDAWGLMREVMSPPDGQPAPILILDLSADLSGMNLDVDGSGTDNEQDALAAIQVLDSLDVKARIINQLMNTLLLAGQREFSKGSILDVCCWLDEAWAYAPQPDPKLHSPAVIALSDRLAGAARDARKLGIGFTYILQAPTGLRDDIFKQITALYIGYGLFDAAELKKLSGRVSDAHLRLYKNTPPPESVSKYTFMLIGAGLTGLSFGSNPVFIEAFNSGAEWLEANKGWINNRRRAAIAHLPDGDNGLPLDNMPPRPALRGAEESQARRAGVVKAHANAAAVTQVSKAGASRTPRPARRFGGSVVDIQKPAPLPDNPPF